MFKSSVNWELLRICLLQSSGMTTTGCSDKSELYSQYSTFLSASGFGPGFGSLMQILDVSIGS